MQHHAMMHRSNWHRADVPRIALARLCAYDLPRSALADHLQMTPEDMSLSKRILPKPQAAREGPGWRFRSLNVCETRFRHAPRKRARAAADNRSEALAAGHCLRGRMTGWLLVSDGVVSSLLAGLHYCFQTRYFWSPSFLGEITCLARNSPPSKTQIAPTVTYLRTVFE